MKRTKIILLALTALLLLASACGKEPETPIELQDTVWGEGAKAAFFQDGSAALYAEGAAEPVFGLYKWDGVQGTLTYGEYRAELEKRGDTLAVRVKGEKAVLLPRAADLTTLTQTTWRLGRKEYTFFDDGTAAVRDSAFDLRDNGTYTWDKKAGTGTVTCQGYSFSFRMEGQILKLEDPEGAVFSLRRGRITPLDYSGAG